MTSAYSAGAIIFFAVLALVATAMVVPASAQAQELTQNSTAVGERIDQNTIITDKEYNADTGRVTISLYSEKGQQISISDAGALFQGKEIDTATVFARQDDHVNLTVSATEVRRQVAVSIRTDETHRGLLVEKESYLIQGPWSSTDAQITGAAGLLAGLSVVTAFAFRRTSRRTQEPERKL
jgi:membrane protein implicated in regulation of membrane protease activity